LPRTTSSPDPGLAAGEAVVTGGVEVLGLLGFGLFVPRFCVGILLPTLDYYQADNNGVQSGIARFVDGLDLFDKGCDE